MRLNPISKTEAARYMGIKGSPDERLSALIDKAEKLVRERITGKYVFREVPLTVKDGTLFAEGMASPLEGEDIKKHLSGCTRAVILAATLSAEADKLIRQAEAYGGMAESLAVDCLCSAAIEQVCNRAEEEIFSSQQYLYRTWRFSPGYGDFPISLQAELLAFLNAARRIGLTVTESCMLVPAKSVTAIIGISAKPVEKGAKGCGVCNMRERCAFAGKCGCRNVNKCR